MQGQQEAAISPVTVFYSYAHEDERLRRQLEKHLSLLRRQGMIAEWHDRKIVPGTDWAHTIDEHLTTASVILLLISPDFLTSDYCYGVEMGRALERHAAGEARVIPILVRPVDWQGAPFAHLHCLPSDAKPVTRWRNLDEAFVDVARGIRSTLEDLSTSQRSPVPPTPRVFAAPQPRGQPSPASRDPNRRRMLERVRSTWIKGVLEQSLHGAALIALGLREQPDVLANPWRLVVQEVDQVAHALPTGTHITQVYDDAEGALLILGEPGAGKTTLLLELTRALLDRAQKDEHLPIPVVFSLSSWARKQPPLTEWLVEELNIRYEVPRRLGQSWVSNDTLFLLLDGLDEVSPAARKECIQAINRYREAHPLVPVVVCSRSDDYLDQATQLLLHVAVIVQPLTQEQIDDYLVSAGTQVEALRVALRTDLDLQELATTPLMLSILTLAYQGTPLDEITALDSLKTRQRQVFDSYVQRMLKRRSAETRYTPRQTMQWLAWLARQMKQQGQTVFYLERMQPDWVSKNRRQRMLSALITGLVSVLLFGLFGVLLFGLIGLLFGSQQHITTATESSAIFWTCDNTGCHSPGPPVHNWSVQQGYGTVQGGLTFALLFGLLSVLIGGVISIRKRSIQPVEVVKWQWAGRRRRLLMGLLIGLGLGLLIGELFELLSLLIWVLLYMQDSSQSFEQVITGYVRQNIIELLFGLKDILLFGGTGLLLGGAMSRTSNELMDEHVRSTPNEGIRRSAWYAVISGLIIMLAGGVSVGLSIGPIQGLFFGLVAGIITGLSNGGIACIQHLLLRVRLWYERVIPWNYVRFLDFAAERILLRKVGGGYIFVHRLLLDYFASLDALTGV